MRRSTAFLLLCLSATLLADKSDLNQLYQQEMEVQAQIDDKASTNLKYSWIKPLVASYSYSKNNQFGFWSSSRFFRVSLDQPIFKSGGIYFAIEYAKANRAFKDVARKLGDQKRIGSLYESLLNLQKVDLELQKLSYDIKSAKIDVKRKEEQFRVGLLDSSFVDRAVLSLSGLEGRKVDLLTQKEQFLSTFRTLSDRPYREISLPHFRTITQKEFIAKNLELQQLQYQKEVQRELKNITISTFLPTVSLFGEYSNRKDDFKIYKQQKNSYKSYGVRISMPLLDINTFRKIEIDKLKYIKAKIDVANKRRALKQYFSLFETKLDLLNTKESILRKELKTYRRLIRVTRDGLRAGEKTKLDLANLKNSTASKRVEMQILDKQRALLYLELYTKMNDEI